MFFPPVVYKMSKISKCLCFLGWDIRELVRLKFSQAHPFRESIMTELEVPKHREGAIHRQQPVSNVNDKTIFKIIFHRKELGLIKIEI